MDLSGNRVNLFCQFVQDVDDILAHEDYVFVLLLVVLQFLKQLAGCLCDRKGKIFKEVTSIDREFFYFVKTFNVLIKLLSQRCVESHSLLYETVGHCAFMILSLPARINFTL